MMKKRICTLLVLLGLGVFSAGTIACADSTGTEVKAETESAAETGTASEAAAADTQSEAGTAEENASEADGSAVIDLKSLGYTVKNPDLWDGLEGTVFFYPASSSSLLDDPEVFLSTIYYLPVNEDDVDGEEEAEASMDMVTIPGVIFSIRGDRDQMLKALGDLGFTDNLSEDEIMKQAMDIGIVITGHTANIAPLEKKIYSLRDVTGTVSSIPLIASSIMSKKIASGADKILIDIKVGKGSLIKTKKDANKLSSLMKKIGKFYNKEVSTVITDMNNPLGRTIGNSLEVIEAIDILKGEVINGDLYRLCIELASEMVSMAKGISKWDASQEVIKVIEDRSAYKKFLEFVKAQGGTITDIEVASNTKRIRARKRGVLESINSLALAEVANELGAGRKSIDEDIDLKVGVELNKVVGNIVKRGDILCTVYCNKNSYVDINKIRDSFSIK